MARDLLNKVLAAMGLEAGLEPEEEIVERDRETMATVKARFGNKVVSLQSGRNTKLMIVEPKSFGEVNKVSDHLKGRRPVIVNVSKLDPASARRVLDFAMGTVYALDGHMQKVSDGVFLFTPSNFDVVSEAGKE